MNGALERADEFETDSGKEMRDVAAAEVTLRSVEYSGNDSEIIEA
jgi:hypothetical protein